MRQEANVSLWPALRRLVLGIALATGACSGPDYSAKVLHVEIGMTRADVLAIMGKPQREETYGGTVFLIYGAASGTNDQLADFIPVALVDGKVTGINRTLYDTVVKAQTPTERRPQ
jgi:hypothetical protein